MDAYSSCGKKLVVDYPTFPGYRKRLASMHITLANRLKDSGRPQEAEKSLRQAVDILAKLTSESLGERGDNALELFDARVELNRFLWKTGRLQEAEAVYQQQMELLRKLTVNFPALPEYQLELAYRHHDVATMLKSAGRPAEAEREYREALALRSKLVADSPANPDYRFHLAHSCLGLAYLMGDNKRTKEAEVFPVRPSPSLKNLPPSSRRETTTARRLAILCGKWDTWPRMSGGSKRPK